MRILDLIDLNYGDTLKQGDSTRLRFQLSAKDYLLPDNEGKQARIVFIFNNSIIHEEFSTVQRGNVVEFSINEILPANVYILEIHVDGQIFPSDDYVFKIRWSAVGIDHEITKSYGINNIIERAVDLVSAKFINLTKEKLGLGNVINVKQASDMEVSQARGSYPSLGQRLDETTAQLAQTESVVGGDSDVIWNPPTQPTSNSILWTGSTDRLERFYALWEGLRATHPTYVTRELLGKDQSGLYDIWKYIFEPVNYEKTVILTSNTHGSEMEGQKILYRFMYHICNDSLANAHMNYMHNKVRIVVIPMVNPWGVQNGTRTNFRGVDINRNFQFGWKALPVGTGTIEYKGTAPLSEAETQYVNNVMQQYADDGAVAYVDVHAGAEYTPNSNTAYYYAEVPERGDSAHNIIHEVIHGVTPDGFTPEKLVLKRINPNTVNQADMVHGLHAVTPEFEPGMVYGVTRYSSEDIHSGLKWIGNIILQFSRLKNRKRDSAEPFVFEVSNNDTTFMTSTLEYEIVPNTQFVFTPEVDGILYVTGECQFVNDNTAANNFMVVNTHQGGNPLLTANHPIVSQLGGFEVMTSLGGKPMTLTSARAVPIYAADKNNTPVTITIRVKTDAGSMTARRSRLHGMFIPTKKIPAYTFKQITNGVVQVDYPKGITIDS